MEITLPVRGLVRKQSEEIDSGDGAWYCGYNATASTMDVLNDAYNEAAS